MKTKNLKILLFLFVLIIAMSNFTAHAANPIFYWTKSPDNPVLTADMPWEGTNVWNPAIVYHDGEYKMWYSADDGQVGYATSVDGIAWEKYAGNPVLTSEGEPPLVPMCTSKVSNPEVIFDGTEWKMWYQTGCIWGIMKFHYAISLATSADGITWEKYPGNPVLSSRNSWEAYSYDSPSVVYRDGLYHMWYTGFTGTYGAIGYATSADGINWIYEVDEPVIGEISYGQSVYCEAVYHEDRYHIWYSSANSYLHATSWDGISWLDDPVNPALEPGMAGSWDENYVVVSSVLFADGQMRMWYSSNGKIGYASAESFSPELSINYASGSQGSYFTLTASQFPPINTVSVIINGQTLTNTLSLDQDGNGVFLLDASQATDGVYWVTVASARTVGRRFLIAETEPQRAPEGSGPVFAISANIGYTEFVYLPLASKR